MWTAEHRGRSPALQYPVNALAVGADLLSRATDRAGLLDHLIRLRGGATAALVTREDGNEAVGLRAPEVCEPPDSEQIAHDGRLASHF